MSGGEISQDVEEQEFQKMEAKKERENRVKDAKEFLDVLHHLDDHNRDDSMFPQLKNVVKEKDFNQPAGQEEVKKLLIKNSDKIKKIIGVAADEDAGIEKITGLFEYLKHYKKTDARLKHDLNNIFVAVSGYLSFYLFLVEAGENLDIDNLDKILAKWDRSLVGVEDILLRIISETEIVPEYNTGLSVETVSGAIKYFEKDELANISAFSKESDSAYKKIDSKEFKSVSLEDWDKINNELGDRQIAGNDGLVGNFILNALRNSLKDRVESDHIKLSASIKGDWFVMRVEDDGKGIASKFLQKGYVEKDEATGVEKEIYIFHEGASGTGSSGIGLANFDTRLASVGGELYVVSKPKYEKEDGIVRFQYGSTPEKANEVEFDENMEHGTVFEIHLPIVQKQK